MSLRADLVADLLDGSVELWDSADQGRRASYLGLAYLLFERVRSERRMQVSGRQGGVWVLVGDTSDIHAAIDFILGFEPFTEEE